MWRGRHACLGGVVARVAWVAWLCVWSASVCSVGGVGGMLARVAIIIVIVIIEKLSWRKKIWMLTFETKIKNVPNKSEQWFKRRTWLKKQVLFYITWTGHDRILNVSESQCEQICLDMCNFANMPEYAWNIRCLNKPELWICLNLLK